MNKNYISRDTAKEFLILLSYCDNSMYKNIPNSFIRRLTELAANSEKEYYFDPEKQLFEQEMSDECWNLLEKVFFMYIIDSETEAEFRQECINNNIDFKDYINKIMKQ